MSIFTKPIAQITFGDIESFCQELVSENVRIEYKKDFSSKDANKQVAKEIAAMANTQGGIILYGVDEEQKKPKLPLCGMDKGKSLEKLESKITSIALDRIYPPISPEVKACEVKGNPNKAVMVIRVIESDQTPHSIEGRTEFYVRANDIAQPRHATLEEIEWLQNRRQKAVDFRKRLIERAEIRTEIPFGRIGQDNPCLIISIVPLFPTHPLTKQNILMDFVDAALREMELLQGYTPNTTTCQDGVNLTYSGSRSHINSRNNDLYNYQLNIFGMLYHKTNQVFHVSPQPAGKSLILRNCLLQTTVSFLSLARDFYRKTGYSGLISFELKMLGVWGKKLHYRPPLQSIGYTVKNSCVEQYIHVERNLPVADFDEKFDEFLVNISSDLLLSCGLGKDGLNRENILAMLNVSHSIKLWETGLGIDA